MATAGGVTKRRVGRRRGRRRTKQKTILLAQTLSDPSHHRHSHLSSAVPLLISAASASYSFLLRHDLRLSPSQSLQLESLLYSTSHSLANLVSLLSLNLPPTPPPPPTPTPLQSTWFASLLSSSSDHDPRWLEFFNLSKPSFTLLLLLLTPSLSSLSIFLSPEAAVAATLFRLSHAASFSSLSRKFGVSSHIACKAFYCVCKAIVDNLGHLFELGTDMGRIIMGFKWISLPNCCGILGVERFDLEDEDDNGFGGCLLVQGLVDSEGRFLDVSAGWPGFETPENVLKRSKFYAGVEISRDYLNGPCLNLNGFGDDDSFSVPQYVLGNSFYPLLPWLLTPFRGKGEEFSSFETAFNSTHRKSMELFNSAFAKVKQRWKLVGRKWKGQCVEALPFVVVACCLLHNFLIKCSKVSPDDESTGNGVFSAVYEGEENDDEDECGKRIRDTLASYLSRVNHRS